MRTVRDYDDADWDRYDQLSVELLGHSQLVMPGGRWYLSTAHTDTDIERTADAFDDAVTFLAGSSASDLRY